MRELVNLSLDEISAVDEPANEGARIVLLKALSKDEKTLMEEKAGVLHKLAKYLGLNLPTEIEDLQMAADDNHKIAKLQAEISARDAIAKANTTDEVDAVLKTLEDDVRASVAEIAKNAKTNMDKAATDEATKEFAKALPAALREPFAQMSEAEQTSFMKRYNAESDPVTKALETVSSANEELVRRMKALEEEAEIRAAREEFSDLDNVKVDEFAKTVVRLRKADKEAADALVEQTRRTAQMSKVDNLFKSIGHDQPADGSAEQELEKSVQKYREEHKVSEAAAYDAVLQANPALYNRYLTEKETH